MSLKNILQSAFKHVHMGVVIEGKSCEIYTTIMKKDHLVKHEKRLFELKNDKLTNEITAYIKKYQDTYTYFYLATTLASINQGAIAGCDDETYHRMHIDTKNIVRVCIDGLWSVYSSQFDVDNTRLFFEPIGGLDYIFPMESVIHFLQHDLGREGTNLYILNNRSTATIAIFDGPQLLYSSHFIFAEDEEEELTLPQEEDEIDQLIDNEGEEGGDESVEEIVELDNLGGDLDNLDQIEDLDNFVADADNLTFEDVDTLEEEEFDEDVAPEMEPRDETSIKRDLLLYNFVKNSIEDYYKNDYYHSKFLERAVVFDTLGGSHSLNKYLRDELMIEGEIKNHDLAQVISLMSVKETGS